MREITVRTGARTELVDITSEVAAALAELGREARLCHVWVPHTTAAVVVNEAADPDVARDLAAAYRALVPAIPFRHAEGNSDAHLLSTLLGSSVTLPVTGGRLRLGTWQGIFLVELDGPRSRRVWVSTV
jgi:secondary thiamine-phosphate synthase enzyme